MKKMACATFYLIVLFALLLFPSFVYAGNLKSLNANIKQEDLHSYRVTLSVTPDTNSTGYNAMVVNRRGFMVMDVFATKDARGNLGRVNIGHSSTDPMKKLNLGVIVPKKKLPYRVNYIWIKVMVDFGGVKDSYWKYAGSIP